jgi:hypothetical protein
MRKCVLIASALSILALAGAASADSFNPQPDPPGRSKGQVKPHSARYRASSRVHAFNPQPDPPGDRHAPHGHASSSSRQVMPALMRARDKPNK